MDIICALVYEAQWGLLTMDFTGSVGAYGYCNFPISFNNTNYIITSIHRGSDAAIAYQSNTEIANNQCVLCAKMYNGAAATPWLVNWIAIGQ